MFTRSFHYQMVCRSILALWITIALLFIASPLTVASYSSAGEPGLNNQTAAFTGQVSQFSFDITSVTQAPDAVNVAASFNITAAGEPSFKSPAGVFTGTVWQLNPEISSVTPAPNAVNVAAGSDIAVQFAFNIKPDTITQNTFNVDGSMTGRIAGAYSVAGNTATFNPDSNFKPGELVTVTLTDGIQDTTGVGIAAPATWQFFIAASGVAPVGSITNFGSDQDGAYSIALGDMDNDGDLDIVEGNCGDPSWGPYLPSYVYIQDGAGNFNNTVSLGTDPEPTCAVAVGDVNHDGYLDIVKGNYDTTSLVYTNNGTGHFSTTIDLGNDATDAVALGDVNNDGYLDIVKGNYGTPGQVYLNDGAGNFSPPSSLGTDDLTTCIALGDVNNDGYLDIIVGNNHMFNDVRPSRVYLNDGTGQFTSTIDLQADMPNSVAVGDINNDGYLDIVEGGCGVPSLVYINDRAGNFNTPFDYIGSSEFIGPVALGDINGDGWIDIVAGNNQGSQSLVCFNDGTGQFCAPVYFGTEDHTYSVVLGDVDGDGDLDIAAGNNWEASVIYFISGVEMNLKQGSVNIAVSGNYNFGSVRLGTHQDMVFTIENLGMLDLTLTTPLTITGDNPDQFSLQTQPAASVVGGGSTTFKVRFSPTSTGNKKAAILIANNDTDHNPYLFYLLGQGSPVPDIRVKGNSQEIVSGNNTPSLTDHTDFGSANIGGAGVTRTFTIENTGTAVLTLGPSSVSLNGDADFSVLLQPPTSVAASGNANFQVKFNPALQGPRNAVVNIASDDPNENPYTFAIQGTGTSTELNQPPQQPVNIAPADQDTVFGLEPILQSSVFTDPNTGDWHAASQWQISEISNDYASPVLDSGTDAAHKTQISVPPGVLAAGTQYFWRVRYQDYNSAWSDWSTETSFTVEVIIYVSVDFTTIQAAVDASSNGCTIMVADGVYNENVHVNKQVIIRSEHGASSATVQAADSQDHVFHITAGQVVIQGFTVTGVNREWYAGIFLDAVTNCTISDNICNNNTLCCSEGIYLKNASYNTITNNTAGYNEDGVCLVGSNHNTIAYNTCSHNDWGGVYMDSSDYNTVVGNIATFGRFGVQVFDSSYALVTDNICTDNSEAGIMVEDYYDYLACNRGDTPEYNIVINNIADSNGIEGIVVHISDNNTVMGNTANSNGIYGILIQSTSNNLIAGNTADSNSTSGLYVFNSANNTFMGNNFRSNSVWGIFVDGSDNNTLYLNGTGNNTHQDIFFFSASTNNWCSPEMISYLSGSNVHSNCLGNFYGGYTGSDNNNDGVGETNLPVATDGAGDSYPVMAVTGEQAWWLTGPSTMYMSHLPTDSTDVTVSAGNSRTWLADYAARENITFAGSAGNIGFWKGRVVFTAALAAGHSFTVDIGSAGADGLNYQSSGQQAVLTGNGTQTEFTFFMTPPVGFTVPQGQHLAFKLTNSSVSDYSLITGQSQCYVLWSYTPSLVQSNAIYSSPVAFATNPANGSFHNDVNMPPALSGAVYDYMNGAGIAANSTTFYIRHGAQYWNGAAWTNSITWLPTTHPASYLISRTAWTGNTVLPAWQDGQTYYLGAKAVDSVGVTMIGPETSFIYDVTHPMVSLGEIADTVTSMPSISGTASDTTPGQLDKVRASIRNVSDNTYWNGVSWVGGETWLDVAGLNPWTYSMPALTNNRTYRVKAESVDKAGNASRQATDIFNFNPVSTTTLTVTGIVAKDKSYDGTTYAELDFTGAVLHGATPGDDVSLDILDYMADFADRSVGNDKAVTVSGLGLNGSQAAKYILTQPAGLTADITGAVSQVQTATNTGTATFSSNIGTLTNLTAVAENTLPPAGKPAMTYPHGFFSFTITGVEPGVTVTVTAVLPSSVPVGTAWAKYENAGWTTLPTGDDDGDNIITFNLTNDGSGNPDTEMTDPGGPGYITQEPGPRMGVGGEVAEVDQSAVLLPWLILICLAMLAGGVLAARRIFRA